MGMDSKVQLEGLRVEGWGQASPGSWAALAT
jgi:hypothetical protein